MVPATRPPHRAGLPLPPSRTPTPAGHKTKRHGHRPPRRYESREPPVHTPGFRSGCEPGHRSNRSAGESVWRPQLGTRSSTSHDEHPRRTAGSHRRDPRRSRESPRRARHAVRLQHGRRQHPRPARLDRRSRRLPPRARRAGRRRGARSAADRRPCQRTRSAFGALGGRESRPRLRIRGERIRRIAGRSGRRRTPDRRRGRGGAAGRSPQPPSPSTRSSPPRTSR